MIRQDADKVRQEVNLGNIKIEGIVNQNGTQYYILTDKINQTTDHLEVGLDRLFDDYVNFFSLVD